MKIGQGAKTPEAWLAFVRQYRAEMKRTEAVHTLNLLAEMSHRSNFSIGCYCEDEGRCHRSVLRELLADRGARFA